MIQRLRTRIANGSAEGGFTLIELLVVIIIIGILLAVAVPSYIGFKSRAEVSAAKANVRAALPAVEAYYSDNGDYTNMTRAALKLIDPNVRLSAEPVIIPATATTPQGYCIQSTHNGNPTSGNPAGKAPHKLTGPGGDILPGTC